MKVLLTGANGQLGRCFQDIVPNEWQLIAADHDVLDITNTEQVESFVKQYQPDVIVNAAAYTAVDKVESEAVIARKINAQGPYNLAIAANKNNARFYHISTDYVFGGEKTKPYLTTDQTNPLGVYGKTKLQGEQLCLKVNPNVTIIRTAWVFSQYGNNFVKTMLRLAKERSELKIVNDQIGCPTYAGDLAYCIIQLIKQNNIPGIYHYCGDEVMSWFDFAKLIISKAYELNMIPKLPKLSALSSYEYPALVKRPAYSVLDKKISVTIIIYQVNWIIR
ncbi:dTDP-4-dehydrorhamnose reductase [Frischella sp. Ac48]|uniref:dTDP-4-dehydrorhamnose reductase n=1 Tax=Frischella sp. Ac48 TaxID=2804531 RepID=UPI001C7D3135|nr:dTDP-4-dehydrorhamnose reductase [Frischella sp. Ac48]